MADFTPSTEQVRAVYVIDGTRLTSEARGEDFDRWLEALVREASVTAWNARGILDQNAVAEWSSDAVRANSAISDVGWRDYELRDDLVHRVLSARSPEQLTEPRDL